MQYDNAVNHFPFIVKPYNGEADVQAKKLCKPYKDIQKDGFGVA